MTVFKAAAATAVLLASALHADSSTYPEPLAAALAMTYEAPEDAHWRFVMDISIDDQTLSAQFDSRLPDGEDWTLLSPSDAADLNESLADIWTEMNTPDDDEESDGGGISIGGDGLFFDAESAATVAGGVRSLGGGRYAFTPDLDAESDEDSAMQDHLTGELSLSEQGHVGEMRIFAPESFKPNAAARVHAFEMRMTFEQPDGLPAPVLTSMSTHIDVSALFQRQTQQLDFRFSDVEYVEP